MYNILFIGRVSVFVMPLFILGEANVHHSATKKIQYDSHKGFMWKKCAKVDGLWGRNIYIYIYFQETQMKKLIAKRFKE